METGPDHADAPIFREITAMVAADRRPCAARLEYSAGRVSQCERAATMARAQVLCAQSARAQALLRHGQSHKPG